MGIGISQGVVQDIDVIMTTTASQITSLTVVYSTVYSDADQRKHQSSASLAFVRGIHQDRWIPCTKGQLRGKCFHLMTSCNNMTPDMLSRMGCRIARNNQTWYCKQNCNDDINSLAPSRLEWNFAEVNFSHIDWLVAEVSLAKLPSDESQWL